MAIYIDSESTLSRFTEKRIAQIVRSDSCGVDDDRLLKAVDAANSLLDGYLNKICPSGVQTISPILTEHAHAIALFFLARTRDDAISEAIKDAYEDALKYLNQIAAGKIRIDCTGVKVGGPSVSVSSPVWERHDPRCACRSCCGGAAA